MAAEGKPKRRFIVSVVGLLLVVLGVLWITVIFPAIDKVPLDYEQTYDFEGTYEIFDPDGDFTSPISTILIRQTLAQEAIGTEDGALLIHEKRTVTNSVTGEDLSDEYGGESTLAIDRRTREFVPDIDEGKRTGYWEPPKLLGEGDTFDLWNPGAKKALTAKYVRSEDFRHGDDVVAVLVFEIDEAEIPITKGGMDLYYRTTITLWIEPSSGTVANQESATTVSFDKMGNQPVQISTLRYAGETIDDRMDTAKSAYAKLLWIRTIIPWVLIGLGAVMVLLDVLVLPRIQARRER